MGTSHTVAGIGDSLMECDVATPRMLESLCALLAGTTCTKTGTELNLGGQGEVYAASDFTLRNLGLTGNEITVEIFGRYCQQCISAGAPGEPYGVIVFEGGVNDVSVGVTGAVIWSYWQLMLDDANTRHKGVVVLVNIPWSGFGGRYTPAREAELQVLWASVAAWAIGRSEVRVVDLALALDVNHDGACDVGLCTDGLHWTTAGAAAVAGLVNTTAGDLIRNH